MIRTLVIAAFLCLVPALATAAPPAGWFLAGSAPKSYTMERDARLS